MQLYFLFILSLKEVISSLNLSTKRFKCESHLVDLEKLGVSFLLPLSLLRVGAEESEQLLDHIEFCDFSFAAPSASILDKLLGFVFVDF